MTQLKCEAKRGLNMPGDSCRKFPTPAPTPSITATGAQSRPVSPARGGPSTKPRTQVTMTIGLKLLLPILEAIPGTFQAWRPAPPVEPAQVEKLIDPISGLPVANPWAAETRDVTSQNLLAKHFPQWSEQLKQIASGKRNAATVLQERLAEDTNKLLRELRAVIDKAIPLERAWATEDLKQLHEDNERNRARRESAEALLAPAPAPAARR